MKCCLPVLGLLCLSLTGFAYERLQGPTEVTYWDRSGTYDGYTFFGTQGTTYLIDMEGRVVHTWPVGSHPRLLADGHVLDRSGAATFVELDWNGSNVWSHTEARGNYFPHGDFLRIHNPKLGTNTTLYIAGRTIASNECIAAGCDPDGNTYADVSVDAIVEVDAAGSVIWEWCFFDHGCQNVDAGKPNYVAAISDAPGRINLNLPGRPLTNDWLHCVSIDYNQALDQIVIAAEGGEFYVIDHGNTFSNGNPAASIALAAGSAGDFLYRFGDPARHGAGSAPSITLNWLTSTTGNKQIGGVGQVTWIPEGLPGAGHFLVFNNGQDLFEHTPQSYIFEVNGCLNAAGNDTGAYVSPPAAGYNTWAVPGHDTSKQKKNLSRQVVSVFMSMANQAFFSHLGGSVQRLPNSNLLVCAASEGHIFEVTPATNVVWEYLCPVTTDGAVAYKRDEWPLYNPVFRATRYSPSYSAFAGRTLSGTATIAGGSPAYISAPAIGGVTQTPVLPYSTNAVTVTASISNSLGVASAALVYMAGAATSSVTMTSSGALYSASIPAQPAGTVVRYFVTARDDFDNTSTNPAAAPAGTFSYTVEGAGLPPVIVLVTQSPLVPTSLDTLTITARITDDVGVASAALTYTRGTGAAVTNTVFLETMASAAVKPWTGAGCDHAWTVTGTAFEQATNWNYGAGNACGMQFKQGTSSLYSNMIATVSGIAATGASGYVEFCINPGGLGPNAGWTMQLDAGTGYVTRLSELGGTNYAWSPRHYDLQPGELVSNLQLRFQFAGGASTNRINLDRIQVRTVTAGAVSSNVAMVAAGGNWFTAQIPAQAAGTGLSYFITAVDALGLVTTGVVASCVIAAAGDTVGDGIPDWWRVLHFGGDGGTTNGQSWAGGDPDNDGMNNGEEYLADTHPTNGASLLALIGVRPDSNGVQLAWIGGVSVTQVVESLQDLAATSEGWTALFTNVPPTAVTNVLQQGSGAADRGCYRIKAWR